VSRSPASASALLLLLVAACSSSSATEAPEEPLQCSPLEGGGYCECGVGGPPRAGADAASCGPVEVGAPAVCCAQPEFVASQRGGCLCESFGCAERSGPTICSCSGRSTSMDDFVATTDKCEPTEGKECCLYADGTSCSCDADEGTCPGTTVPDCTVERLTRDCTVYGSFREAVPTCR
jgi:hypothetical protein